MTTVQFILIIIAFVIMIVGLILIVRGLRDNSNNNDKVRVLTDEKGGIPILPRHKRKFDDETVPANSLNNNPTEVAHQEHEIDANSQSTPDSYVDIDTTPEFSDQNYIDQDYMEQDYAAKEQLVAENELHTNTHVDEFNQQLADSPNFDGLSEEHGKFETDDDLFSTLASATESLMPAIETVEEPDFDDNSPVLDQHLLAAVDQDQNSPLNHAEQNINITIMPHHGHGVIKGSMVLKLVEQYGLKYGAMNMFHRYENKDGSGILWFSMMGITDEGIAPFDLNSLPTAEFEGLVLFLSLPHTKAMQGFDSMMSIVGLIARQLNAQVLDENNKPLTRERKLELRNLVQEYQFSRREQ